jgi:hypothetical protein
MLDFDMIVNIVKTTRYNRAVAGGVFNIPIGVPGFLSLQMYAREFSHLSYFAR